MSPLFACADESCAFIMDLTSAKEKGGKYNLRECGAKKSRTVSDIKFLGENRNNMENSIVCLFPFSVSLRENVDMREWFMKIFLDLTCLIGISEITKGKVQHIEMSSNVWWVQIIF